MRYTTLVLSLGLVAVCCGSAMAQTSARQRGYQPLNQLTTPGVAGSWARGIHPEWEGYFQPVKVEVPGGGTVTYYDEAHRGHATASGEQVELQLGLLYRMRIGEMPDFPGIELYPSVELISRLHPPPGRKSEYPVPLVFEKEEIEAAATDKLVTKIIYLEHPDFATPVTQKEALRTQPASREVDALRAADELGRPMAILRMGGRLPPAGQPGPAFLGRGGPVQFGR